MFAFAFGISRLECGVVAVAAFLKLDLAQSIPYTHTMATMSAAKHARIASIHKCVPSPPPGKTHPTTLHITLEDKVGALDDVLHLFKKHSVSLTRIESRRSKYASSYDFFIEFNAHAMQTIAVVVEELKAIVAEVVVVSSGLGDEHMEAGAVPWFPRRMRDLDGFAEKVLEMGDELSADHPGANDAAYRQRRAEITRIAKTYRTGQPIPRIEYTQDEIATWRAVYTKLTSLYPTHACKEHNYVFPMLEQNCGYSPDNIPQLEDISRFLKENTGFTLRPVMGLLTSRDFLNGLAFRVFHSTQYIRHHSKPLYTPEPDVCHELLGHVPLFADPGFADFSQEIGLASLGASDDDISKLATIYWFTVEFGLCKQKDEKTGETELRAFGAGLLSSFGELEYCLQSDAPKRIPFDPSMTAVQEYPITQYQPVYYVAESFKDAKEKVRQFASGLSRGFALRYDPYTECVEVLDSKERLLRFAREVRGDVARLVEALERM